MRIQHNVASLNTHRQLGMNQLNATKNLEKLSSGYKINRAGDDAAGLAISEKMRGQISGLNMASKNAQDSISLIQTTEGALNEVHAMLQRGRELSVQAANDSNTESDRTQLQKEVDQLLNEINDTADRTEFNTLKVLKPRTANDLALSNTNSSVNVITNEMNSVVNGNVSNTTFSNTTGASGTSTITPELKSLTEKMLDSIIGNAEKAAFDAYGITPDKVNMQVSYIDDDPGDRVAWVTVQSSWTLPDKSDVTSRPTALTLDKQDFFGTSALWIEPDRIVAHEMVHAVMGGAIDKFSQLPDWFTEGAAEYVAGANERVNTSLHNINVAGGGSMTEAAQLEALANMVGGADTSDEYSAGFLAVKYLDSKLADSGKTMKDLMGDLAAGKSLDDAIHDNAGYTDASAFLADFKSPTGAATYFATTDFSHGTGSILAGQPGYTDTDAGIMPDGPATSTLFTYTWDDSTGYVEVMNERNGTNNSGSGTGISEESKTSPEYVSFQIGANEGQAMSIKLPEISTSILGIDTVSLLSHDSAASAITRFDGAIATVSDIRANLGAVQNRLEYTITNLQNTAENVSAAESRIRDTDMASEMMKFTKNNILTQAAQSMLSQANQQPQNVLQLLG